MLDQTPLTDDDAPHPADHKLLSRTVADWLAERIISGEEEPGTRLKETTVARRAGVSRSPVREALRILEGEGLVDIIPRYGAFVAHIGIADVEELYACRMLLEPVCARLAVNALHPAEVGELDLLRIQMENAVRDGDARRFLSENINYFRTLMLHCPNATLLDLVELTWKKAVRYWSIFARLPRYGVMSIEQHRALHEAVRTGDGAAAEEADRVILQRALQVIIDTFEHPATT
jgi:DNA-binding GntR family transcriptional regulator